MIYLPMGKRTLLGLFACVGIALLWALLQVEPSEEHLIAEEAALQAVVFDGYEASGGSLVAPGPGDQRAGAGPAVELPAAELKTGPRGRLMTAADGAGIGGVTFYLRKDGALLASQDTGPDGTFAFADAAPLGSLLGPQQDPRFSYEPKQLMLRRLAQARGAELLVFRAEFHSEGVVHGRVIDARTFEAVPSFRLGLRDAIDNNERVVTDAEGYYEGVTHMLPGYLRVGLRDEFAAFARYPMQRLAWPVIEEPLEVAVRVGPTYKLAFQPPAGLRVENFYAEVRGRGEPSFRVLERDYRSSLRSGRPPWVRLRPAEISQAARAEYELVITSEDGYWVGRAAVQSVVGIHPGVLPVDLKGCGILRGRIRDQEGDGQRARIILTRDSKRVANLWTTNEGSFDIPGLLEGEYDCQLIGVAAESFRSRVRVLAGETTLMSWALRTRPREHALVGRLRSRSGRLSQRAEVWLYDREGHSWPTRLTAIEERGQSFQRVESRELPAGFYRPVARFGGAEYESLCDPFEVRAELAGAAAEPTFEILVQDHGGEGRLQVVLCDEENQRSVEGEVCLVGEGWSRYERTSGGVAGFRNLPPEPEVWTWYVHAEGFGMASGLSVSESGVGGLDPRLEVELRPGWGVVVRVLSADGEVPQPGVEVFIDGMSQGLTGAQGRLVVRAQGRPKRLSIEAADWQMVSSRDVLAPDGQFRVANWADVIVRVEPKVAER